jgi:hypothetical protein
MSDQDAAPARASLRGRGDLVLGLVAVSGLVAGAAFHLVGLGREGDIAWGAQIGIMLLPLGVEVGRTLLRRDLGVDLIALIAMAAALALGEYLAVSSGC